MRTTLQVIVVSVVAVFMLALAGPAFADHDHTLTNPGGCHEIPVGVQDHDDGRGNKFHGAAHKGAATGTTTDVGILGKGNSGVAVAGGSC